MRSELASEPSVRGEPIGPGELHPGAPVAERARRHPAVPVAAAPQDAVARAVADSGLVVDAVAVHITEIDLTSLLVR